MAIFQLRFFALEGETGAALKLQNVAVFELDEHDASAAIKCAMSAYGLGLRYHHQIAELRDDRGSLVKAWPAPDPPADLPHTSDRG